MGALQYSDFLLYVMVLTAFMAQHAYEMQRKHEINIREFFSQRAICKNVLLCLYMWSLPCLLRQRKGYASPVFEL